MASSIESPKDQRTGVLVITGISASGKSTVAQALAERLPRSVHVRGDSFRRMDGQVHMAPDAPPEAIAQLRLPHRLTSVVADAYCEHGFTAIVQDIVLGEHLVEITRTISSRPLALVVLAPGLDTVQIRVQQRRKTGSGPDWMPEDLDHVLRHETPGWGCGWTRRP